MHTVLRGVTISNGLVWSLDGTTVYYVDSPTQRVDAFDFDQGTGAFTSRRTVVNVPPDPGTPDGMTIDVEGGLWGGAAVHGYSPDGQLDTVTEVPARQVTACAFGDAALDRLFITTSRIGVADGEQPAPGACSTSIRGSAGSLRRPSPDDDLTANKKYFMITS